MARRSLKNVIAVALMASILPEVATAGGGLSSFSQGAKAMGMGGAFVAQADNPTTAFYNVGGIGMVEGKVGSVGASAFLLNEALYQGLPPGSGAGTAGEQSDIQSFIPHVYGIIPLTPAIKMGLAINTPFRLETDWLGLDSFAGRRIAQSAQLETFDLSTSLAVNLTPKLGIGIGVVYRTSEVQLTRRHAIAISGTETDVGSLAFDTDMDDGIGWQFGLLHKAGANFSWGLTYRSAIQVDYDAVGVLTQVLTGNDQVDQLILAALPFGDELAAVTSLEFPEVATVGVAFGSSERLLVELDAEWTGWSTVQNLPITYINEPAFDQTIELRFEDTLSYRAGLQYTTLGGFQLRMGVAMETSPQPDNTVGPFLANKDRMLYSLGLGLDWLDVAFTWIDEEQRVITSQVDSLEGNYRSNAWIAAMTTNF